MINQPYYEPPVEPPASLTRRINELMAYVQALEQRIHDLDKRATLPQLTPSGYAYKNTQPEKRERVKREETFPISNPQVVS